MNAQEILRQHNACAAAVKWIGKRQPARAWAQCPRGDWMLWIAARVGVDRKLVVRATCDCVRTALKFVPKGEKRPLVAIQTAERWCRGEATIEEVRRAAYAAYAAYAASAAAASAAAAAYAASAAYAAYAASAASDAAEAAAPAARTKAQKRCAALVRKRIPWSVVKAAIEDAARGKGGGK